MDIIIFLIGLIMVFYILIIGAMLGLTLLVVILVLLIRFWYVTVAVMLFFVGVIAYLEQWLFPALGLIFSFIFVLLFIPSSNEKSTQDKKLSQN